jgi:hypothetical protein
MRIALIDRPNPEDRPDGANRFAAVGRLLQRHGHEVLVLDGAPPTPAAPPILTGLNRAVAAAPMIEAHALAHYLATLRPDLVLAPLRGGILQGIVMARACREAFAATRIGVWCDTPSRTRFLREDDLSSGLAPLIADALERQVVRLADAIILPTEGSLHSFSGWERRGTILLDGELPPSPDPLPASSLSGEHEYEEIVFSGPLSRHRGVVEFIAVVERLAGRGLLAGRTVTFLGPIRTLALGIGQEWLGLRAASWTFPFRTIHPADSKEYEQYLRGAGRLAVAVAHDPDELLGIRRCGRHHIALLRGDDEPRQLADRLESALRDRLSGRFAAVCRNGQPMDWPMLIERIAALPLPPTAAAVPGAGVTVCVLHRNRLSYLAEALASIPNRIDGQQVELLVVDNASEIPFVEGEIQKLAGPRDLLRVIGYTSPVPQASALNRAVKEARFETVVFLDDDNCFTTSGVERIARAIAAGGFDIVVSALEVFDDGPRMAATAGRLIFLGAAYSAGLFFNAFGDTAMAVRRDAFLALGSFRDPGYSYPALDWVTLAKAQAAGLRIGVLQWPAVRYRRSIVNADLGANKMDQEGARSLVFEAYGNVFDAELVVRYAQKLQLEEL